MDLNQLGNFSYKPNGPKIQELELPDDKNDGPIEGERKLDKKKVT